MSDTARMTHLLRQRTVSLLGLLAGCAVVPAGVVHFFGETEVQISGRGPLPADRDQRRPGGRCGARAHGGRRPARRRPRGADRDGLLVDGRPFCRSTGSRRRAFSWATTGWWPSRARSPCRWAAPCLRSQPSPSCGGRARCGRCSRYRARCSLAIVALGVTGILAPSFVPGVPEAAQHAGLHRARLRPDLLRSAGGSRGTHLPSDPALRGPGRGVRPRPARGGARARPAHGVLRTRLVARARLGADRHRPGGRAGGARPAPRRAVAPARGRSARERARERGRRVHGADRARAARAPRTQGRLHGRAHARRGTAGGAGR